MRTYIFALLILLATGSNRAYATPQDTLWWHAVAVAGANELMIPGMIVEEEQVFNKKGKLEETSAYRMRLHMDEGKLDIALLGATKNGQDITQQANQQPVGDAFDEKPEDNPFSPRVQRHISVHRTGETKEVDGKTYIAFAYRQMTPDNEWEGVAWLEEHTGVPLELEAHPTRYPIKIDGVKVEEMSVHMRFTFDQNGLWYMDTATVNTRFAVKIMPFITFRGSSETVTTFADYWAYEL